MRLVIKSVPQNIAQIEHYLGDLFEAYHIHTDLYPDILISLTEAVNNAMIHGNDLDKSKVVSVRSYVGDEEVKFHVSDEGEGFDPTDLPDPCKKKNIALLGGRGVMLMRELTSSICYKNGGATVELVFRRK